MILQMISQKNEMFLLCKITSRKDNLKGSQISSPGCKLQCLEQLVLLSHC